MTNFQANDPTLGILLINLGTPKSTELQDIKSYLKEFLNDPYVIDIPAPLRWLLVNGIILNVRPRKTQHAYKSIWTEQGSPLMVISKKFHSAFNQYARQQGFEGPIELAMRYSEPNLKSAIRRLVSQGTKKIVALPLYPQYALSSTETAIAKTNDIFKELNIGNIPVHWVPAFYNEDAYIQSLAQTVRDSGALDRTDFLLMSFHGLPERHVKKTDGANGKYCLSNPDCCKVISDLNQNCYRAQSYQTAKRLAQELGLPDTKWRVGFQSRLTRRWIQPFTDQIITDLPKSGIKRVAVTCPSFTVDCLETLEEIGLRAKEDFIQAGGQHLELIPCLNDHPSWIKGAWSLVSR